MFLNFVKLGFELTSMADLRKGVLKMPFLTLFPNFCHFALADSPFQFCKAIEILFPAVINLYLHL